jgi:hypothetical protein
MVTRRERGRIFRRSIPEGFKAIPTATEPDRLECEECWVPVLDRQAAYWHRIWHGQLRDLLAPPDAGERQPWHAEQIGGPGSVDTWTEGNDD